MQRTQSSSTPMWVTSASGSCCCAATPRSIAMPRWPSPFASWAASPSPRSLRHSWCRRRHSRSGSCARSARSAAPASLVPSNAEVLGLLALELYGRSRTASRFAGDELVLLEDQDRTRWDVAEITRANSALAAALALEVPGPFQLQAWIASHHANARTAADTDWPAIASAYAQLAALTSSPIVTLNRAVAIAMADGPPAGLALLAFRRALALATNAAEQRHLEQRLAALHPSAPPQFHSL